MRHSVLQSLSQLMAPCAGSRPPPPGHCLPKPCPGHSGATRTRPQQHRNLCLPPPLLELPPPTHPVCVLLWAPHGSSVQSQGCQEKEKQDLKVLMTHFSSTNDHFSVLFLQWTPLSQDLCRIHSHVFFIPPDCYFLPTLICRWTVYHPIKNYSLLLLQELYSNPGIAFF